MGRKSTKTRKYLHFCLAYLVVVGLLGCTAAVKPLERDVDAPALPVEESKPPVVEVVPPPVEAKPHQAAYDSIALGKKLLAEGDFEAALKEYQKALSEANNDAPGDEAIFNIGLIFAHFGNPKKNYVKSIGSFRKLIKDYPESPLMDQARILVAMLQENLKLSDMIEKSKKIDIEIEEKRRERVR